MLKLIQVDARGLACPQPIMMARNVISENPEEFEIIVDNGAPKTNVPRFIKRSGYKVELIEKEDEVTIIARR